MAPRPEPIARQRGLLHVEPDIWPRLQPDAFAPPADGGIDAALLLRALGTRAPGNPRCSSAARGNTTGTARISARTLVLDTRVPQSSPHAPAAEACRGPERISMVTRGSRERCRVVMSAAQSLRARSAISGLSFFRASTVASTASVFRVRPPGRTSPAPGGRISPALASPRSASCGRPRTLHTVTFAAPSCPRSPSPFSTGQRERRSRWFVSFTMPKTSRRSSTSCNSAVRPGAMPPVPTATPSFREPDSILWPPGVTWNSGAGGEPNEHAFATPRHHAGAHRDVAVRRTARCAHFHCHENRRHERWWVRCGLFVA